MLQLTLEGENSRCPLDPHAGSGAALGLLMVAGADRRLERLDGHSPGHAPPRAAEANPRRQQEPGSRRAKARAGAMHRAAVPGRKRDPGI